MIPCLQIPSAAAHGGRQTATALLAALAIWLTAVPAPAADQPQWGERYTRNMVSAERGLPETFDPGTRSAAAGEDRATAPGAGVRWIAPLGSRTYGTPCVAGGRVYIGTNNDRPRDPRLEGDRGVLLCLDERDGHLLWQLALPKYTKIKWADVYGTGFCSSVAVEGDRVYVVSNRGEVLCLDPKGMADGNDGPFKDEARLLAREGGKAIEPSPRDADIIWLYDMIERLGVSPHDSTATSILVYGDLLYVPTANGLEWTHSRVANPKAPSLIVLDKRTGELVAVDNFGIGEKIVHGQWSAPSVGEVDGQPMIFFAGGDGVLYAFPPVEPKNQAERPAKLDYTWKFRGAPAAQTQDDIPVIHKVSSPNYKVTAHPVFHGSRIYLPFTQEPFHRTNEGRLTCIELTGSGRDRTRSALRWFYDELGPTASTVSIADGLVFAASFDGTVHCLDANSGKVHWTHDAGQEIWGSTLVADGKLYVANTVGVLTVMAAAKQKKVLATVRVPEGVHCSPVAANGTLYLPTRRWLYAVGK